MSLNRVYIKLLVTSALLLSSIGFTYGNFPCAGIGITVAPAPVCGTETVVITYNGDNDCINCIILYGDGTSSTGTFTSTSPPPDKSYSSTGTYTIQLLKSDSIVCCEIDVVVSEDNVCCSSEITQAGINSDDSLSDFGSFYLDENTGEIFFIPDDCPAYFPFECIDGPKLIYEVEKVISASAVTFQSDWDFDDAYYYNTGLTNANDFETGRANKWRPHQQYVYREDIDQDILLTFPIPDNEYKNFDRGIFDMVPFDWKDQTNNDPDKWVFTSTTNRYTPNGEPEEDENILEIKSTAIYGYNHTLPLAVAQNAAYNSVRFAGFENTYSSNAYLESGLPHNTTLGEKSSDEAHTGFSSLKLKEMETTEALELGRLEASQQIMDQGIMVRMWFKITDLNDDDPIHNDPVTQTISYHTKLYYKQTSDPSWVDYVQMTEISKAGEWALYEGIITSANLAASSITATSPDNDLNIGLWVGNWGSATGEYDPLGGDIFLDDVRIQPYDAEMVTYVYDDAQRLVAVFDDQHYAMIYQYNMEGALVRKLKETVKGVKTISETQYNTQGESNW